MTEEKMMRETREGKPQTADKKENERVTRMGSGNIPALVVEFAVPAILGMLVNGAYNIIDSVFLGHGAGEIGLSAVSVATPIMTVFMAISMLIGAGGNALCALRLGEGKHSEAEHVLGQYLHTRRAGIHSARGARSCACLHRTAALAFFGHRYGAPYARDFIQIISLGCVFQIVGMGINNFIRTCGAPNRAFLTMLIGAVGCTIFNAIFVMGMGLGVVGSAWATVCGQCISCITVVWYFTKTPGVPLRLRRKYLAMNGALVRKILALGTASFVLQIGAAVSQVVTNYALVKYGAMSPIGADNALAAVGVVGRVAMFTILPLIGMSIAVQPLLGFNYGAKLWHRVKKTLAVGMLALQSSVRCCGCSSWCSLRRLSDSSALPTRRSSTCRRSHCA